ncbi:MAG: UDP-4-amino-4,6-dideoxy-N-acetyl-beta-L-altrosamine transaminase [Halioglobus sp.]
MIPYGRQDITSADIDAVVDVLRSDYLTQGPVVPKFESAISSYCGAQHAVAVNSATSALHIACLALGLGPGDVLWTSPITFVASANCALYCGATVDFVDIDPRTFNLSVEALRLKLEEAERVGQLPKIVVPVHFGGLPCDMGAIGKLSRQYGFFVIEDASHAIGARYRDMPVGSGEHSDITVFSFHPVKIITTGEGGAAVTNDAALAEKMTLLRSHGITRDPEKMDREPDGDWYYQQIELGYNYRMTDIQAALGLSQITRLDSYVRRRHELACRYDEMLAELSVTAQHRPGDCYSGMHLYVIRLSQERCEKTHKQVFDYLRTAGIGVNLHYIPVHLQPCYRERGFVSGDFPESERYYTSAISLPMYPVLDEVEQLEVMDVLKGALV